MSDYTPSSVLYLDWPSPLQDRSAEFDPIVGVKRSGEHVLLQHESGRNSNAFFTVPLPGVLRLTLTEEGDGTAPGSAMLVRELAATPPSTREIDGGVEIDVGNASCSWTARGLSFGTLGNLSPDSLALVRGATGRMTSSDGPGWLLAFSLDPDARIYGGGESFQGPNLRGRLRRVVNCETHTYSGLDSAYINAPFFWSDAGWGIFLHTSGPARADLASTHSEVAAFSVEGEALDVFLFSGSPEEILRSYFELTGKPSAFPDWAFGVWMSRCSYMSAEEIVETVDELRRADCPVDVVHVDAWVSGNVIHDLACNWTVDRERFPEGWTKELATRSVGVSLWHNPYVVRESSIAAQLEKLGYLALLADGTPAVTADKLDRYVIDFTNPAAVDWWKEQVRRLAREERNVSFKPDFGEEVPEQAIFFDGRTGRQLRNEYALLYQRATHEVMSELSKDGVALFCRSGTSGSQRYPCHWVGDTPSTWIGMTSALRACLSLSLSGFGIVGHDVGGFFRPDTFDFDKLEAAFDTFDNSVFEAEVDPELYARWAQWGACSPVMRFHGTGKREPTAYPEPARTSAIEACRVRERLRPYLVRTGSIAATEGIPMMRPMPLAYPDDRTARGAELQYLLGPDILVAPILAPGGSRTFYVPEGSWKGLMGLDPLEGPGWATVQCDIDQFPAFVKASVEWPLRE